MLRTFSANKNYFFLIFLIIYALISLVNHYFYRTYALDLGLYNNAIWDYAHFRFNDSTTFKETPENLLADHFDLILPLISPLVFLFGTYTLLVVQIVMLYLGGLGVQRFLQAFTNNNKMAALGRLYFYLHFGVYAALSFDYHSNVIAACLVPWFLYCVYTEKRIRAYVLLAFTLLTKENTSLWMFSCCMLMPFILKKEQAVLFISAGVSFLYFLIVTTSLMPALSETGNFAHFKYSVLGHDYLEAVSALFMEPFAMLKNIFVNHMSDPSGDYVKAEFWLFFLASGGVIMLFRPLWLLILLPVFFQKLLHDQVQMWGVNSQYSIELAPFMAMGIFSYPYVMRERFNRAWMLPALIIVLCLGTTIRLMDNTITYVPKENLRFYQGKHYAYDFDHEALEKACEKIPDTAAVSCQSFILPHLALRDHVYQFPLLRDAKYILLVENERTWPLTKQAFTDEMMYYLNRKVKYEVLYAKGNVYLFYQRD